MAAIAGKGGSIKTGVNTITNIKQWKLDVQSDVKDTTNFGSNGWKEQLPTLRSFGGSADGTWNVSTDTTGQTALQQAMLNGTTLSMEFNVNGTNKYTGTCIIKKISIDEAVDDVVKFNVDFEGTGALTYA